MSVISFREVEMDDAKTILDWRASPRVSKYMITDIACDIEAQRKWIAGIYSRADYYLWIIAYGGMPIGCIYLEDFNLNCLQTSWGFYKGVSGLPGIGPMVLPCFYNWLFFVTGIRDIFTSVFYENTRVMELYLKYGHVIMPEMDRVVRKYGHDMLLARLHLSRENWDAEKYAKYVAPFPTQRWKYSPV